MSLSKLAGRGAFYFAPHGIELGSESEGAEDSSKDQWQLPVI